jgi:hypothetical protein
VYRRSMGPRRFSWMGWGSVDRGSVDSVMRLEELKRSKLSPERGVAVVSGQACRGPGRGE